MTTTASKHLDRVSKLINQADRSPEGSPEREAFMEKAIALAQANSIDLALARSHQANKEKVEHPEERKVKVGDYHSINDNFRVSRASNSAKWLCELLTRIAEPNDVKCLISRDSVYVWLNGFPSDLDVVERLYASLAVQMVSEADSLIKKGAHKQKQRVRRTKRIPNPDYIEDEWERRYEGVASDPDFTRKTIDVPDDDEDGNPVYVEKLVGTDGRVWRANFYNGFISRVVSRMWQERRDARKAAGVTDPDDESNSTAVALRDKEAELKSHWEEKTKYVRGTHKGAEVTQYDDDGRERGQQAGARASLGREARVDNQEKKALG